MDSGWQVLLAAIGIGLILVLLVRYAERAISEGRPGWTSPPEDHGIRCPNAIGHKGDEGQPGREEHELQSRSDR